ncbi:MAG: hypothetical protein CMJ64_27455 [Planctomycetaceae bacterium]|nr:hypothetical protein [Planctomycetaceae bacterium]
MIATARPTLRWHSAWAKTLPIAALAVGVLLARPFLPAWGFMWVLAVATFQSVKWLTLVQYVERARTVSLRLSVAYLCGWPGMDAKAFLSRKPAKLSRLEWYSAIAKLVFGGVLLWGVARLAMPLSPLAAGWIGMAGLLFMMHFGFFHLLSLSWREAGFDARPLMNAPILANSVSDFWSRRWNMAFRDAAYQLVFRPLSSRVGGVVAALAVFGVSGIVHDLVISLPAGAGFGLPTLYFAIQAVGFLCERRHPSLRTSWPGRCLAIVIVLGPLPLLFHTPFVNAVVLPMLTAFGAL